MTTDQAVNVVKTQSGAISGTGGDVQVFLGIPFAAPPVGDLRWRAPAPPEQWQGVRPGDAFGNECMQDPRPGSRAPGLGEDCLTLNVWTPAPDSDARLPVMVWIHGGSYLLGGGSDPKSDGEGFAKKGVVYVTFNYRLGVFGFLAHPALSAESPEGSSSNYGLLDNIAALRWIKENIAGFGGDPDRVTLFGCSAGSASIGLLLASPLAAGLFEQAILESPGVFRPLCSLADAEKVGVAAMGDDLAAMRQMTTEEVFAKTPEFVPKVRGLTTPRVLRPIRDGLVIPADERDAWAVGRTHPMPILVGSNTDEGSRFVGGWPIKTLDQYRANVAENFTHRTDEALGHYPAAGEADILAGLAHLFGDTQFHYGAWKLAVEMSRRGPATYRYVFTRQRAGADGPPGHTDELDYVFGRLAISVTEGKPAFDATDAAVSETMMDAWVRFAATGDPNGPGLPQWPAYGEQDDRYMEFGDAPALGAGWRAPQMAFLEDYFRETLDA